MLKAGKAASLSDGATENRANVWVLELAEAESARRTRRIWATTSRSNLKQAIDSNDLDRVKLLMTRNPASASRPLGYGKNGPLTWVAECRVPWEPPTPVRLAMAQWMIDNGSDVHQGGDGPLMRAALRDDRIPMMELLLRNGADVNAEWAGFFPIIFAPCETLAPGSLRWLIDHGANPDCASAGRKYPDTALDYVIGTYSRSDRLGAMHRYSARCPLPDETQHSRSSRDSARTHRPAARTSRCRPCAGESAIRGTRFRNHWESKSHTVAVDHCSMLRRNTEMSRRLSCFWSRGADVNARAEIDEAGVGGQTPIFHAVSQFFDFGLPMVEFLVKHGADLSISARIPGHYERPEEVVESTPLWVCAAIPWRRKQDDCIPSNSWRVRVGIRPPSLRVASYGSLW